MLASFPLLVDTLRRDSRNLEKPSSSSGHKYFMQLGVRASRSSRVNSASFDAEPACLKVLTTQLCREFLAHAGRTSWYGTARSISLNR
jgi:hypothetical protein